MTVNDPCGQVTRTVNHRLRPSVDSARSEGRRKRLKTASWAGRGDYRLRGVIDRYESHSQWHTHTHVYRARDACERCR